MENAARFQRCMLMFQEEAIARAFWMNRVSIIAAALILIATSPAAAQTYSWGKPGASRSDFDEGGVRCSYRAATRDVSDAESTRRYVQGFEALERENNMPAMPAPPSDDPNLVRAERQVLLRRMYAPDRQVDELQSVLQADVAACLKANGYVRFELTRTQARKLRKLAAGSEARKAYLFALGSDATVIERQRVR